MQSICCLRCPVVAGMSAGFQQVCEPANRLLHSLGQLHCSRLRVLCCLVELISTPLCMVADCRGRVCCWHILQAATGALSSAVGGKSGG